MAKSGQRKCLSCGEFFILNVAMRLDSTTVASQSVVVPARPQPKPPGWPNYKTATTSQTPRTLSGYRLGVSLTPVMDERGARRLRRHKMPYLCNRLILLKKLSVVMRYLALLRYKMS